MVYGDFLVGWHVFLKIAAVPNLKSVACNGVLTLSCELLYILRLF